MLSVIVVGGYRAGLKHYLRSNSIELDRAIDDDIYRYEKALGRFIRELPDEEKELN